MKVYNTEITPDIQKIIVDAVREKKELHFFSESYILKYAEHLLKKNKKLRNLIDTNSLFYEKKEFKIFIKEIREKARRIYGTYMTKKYAQKEILLEDIQSLVSDDIDKNKDLLKPILETHLSTKERLLYYEEFKQLVKSVLEKKGLKLKNSTVLDLGCGLNPLAWMFDCKNIVASDIGDLDLAFLETCFSVFGREKILTTIPLDLSEQKDIETLQGLDADICFMLKILDPIEESNSNITYELLPVVQCSILFVSFPTTTISNKSMRNPRRNWFEKVLHRLEYSFETKEIGNELFYVVFK